MPNPARKPDGRSEGGNEPQRRPTSAPRITVPLDVDRGRTGTRKKIAGALSREADHDEHDASADPGTLEPANNTTWFGKVKEAASGVAGWSIEKGTEIQAAWREYNQVRKSYLKGEHTKEQIQEAVEAIIKVLGVEGALTVMSWPLSKLASWYLEARDHELHKDTPDYSDLSGQIADFHEDEDHPGMYHHATESLCAGIEERALAKHYSALRGRNKFRQTYGTPDGRKKIKDQLGKLLGSEVDEIHELTDGIEAMAGRLNIAITGVPPAAVFTPHDLQHRHANHSLHALSDILQLVYNEVTVDRLAKIMGPNEDIKLEKDINKLGATLMEQVKSSTDLAEQFLGNIDINVFDKAFRLLLDRGQLDEAVSDESEEVKKQLYELFNLSGHVNANELNAFMNGLIGLPPYAGAIPANHNCGALGMRGALSPTAQIKCDQVRERMDRARCNLLGITHPSLVSNPAEATNSPRSQLFPPKAETINYADFGAQLGKAVRNKNGLTRLRARSIFLRGWEQADFREHFLQLTDAGIFTNVLDGEQAGKDKAIELIRELTGIKNVELTQSLVDTRLGDLMRDIQDDPTNPNDRLVTGSAEHSKMGQMVRDLTGVRTRLASDWNRLFPAKAETIKYEEFGAQLGKAVRNKNGAALQRARSNFLRGWDAGEFENHFLQLADATSFSSAVAGSKTERDALKKLITELTGLNVTRVNLGLWQTRMRELRTRIGVNGGGPPPAPYTYDPVDAGLDTTKQAPLANILGRIEQIVGPELDNLYVEESLERNLGSTLTNADDAKLAGLFNKLNNGFFVLNYGALGLTPTSFNLTTTNMATRKAFKDQLSAFIGANAHFIWTETNVRALLDALDDKADDVDRLSRGGVHANSANLRSRVTHLRNFIGQPAPAPVAPAPAPVAPAPAPVAPAPASANLIEYLGTI